MNPSVSDILENLQNIAAYSIFTNFCSDIRENRMLCHTFSEGSLKKDELQEFQSEFQSFKKMHSSVCW